MRSSSCFVLASAFTTLLAFVFPADAAVSAFFSNGNTCSGGPAASFSDNGSAVRISLCASSTSNEKLCGFSINLRAASATESGRFAVTAAVLSPSYPDANSATSFPILITNPASSVDLGGTVNGAPVTIGQNQLLASFDLAAQSNATNSSYVISLGGVSALSVDTDGGCLNTNDVAPQASITLTRGTSGPITPTVPGAPAIVSVAAGNQSATVNFAAPSDGGSAITSYRAQCTPGNTSMSGASSPLVVTGLTNGQAYFCSVTATNAVGTGQASAAMSVIPIAASSAGPADYTDMWWAGQSENGWGVSITQHGNVQFIVLYVFDAIGRPVWYAMPGGTWNADFTAYTGLLYFPTSSPFSAYDANQFRAGGAGNASVGSATITYSSASTAVLSYMINGVSGSKTITRQVFGADDGQNRLRVGDMWWGGNAQNGWGLNIAQQGAVLFPVWYTYDASSNATWYAMPGGTWNGNTYTGDLYTTRSSAWLGASYNPSQFVATKVGSMALNFTDRDNAQLTYTVGAVTQTKSISRQPY